MIKVFLVENVPSLGRLGDEVLVPRGMARNLLFPRDLAIPVNAETKANFMKLKAEAMARNAKAAEAAEAIRSKLAGITLYFYENTPEDSDKLFGSVSARQIAEKLSEESGLTISHESVGLHSPIKILGEHNVKITVHSDVCFDVAVHVVRHDIEHH